MASRPVSRIRRWGPVAGLVGVVSVVLSAAALVWMASEAHYRSCVDRASAAFPAVPVSAYVGTDKTAVGPLKVSFVRERAKALDDCHHF
jgi:hypothetical protein